MFNYSDCNAASEQHQCHVALHARPQSCRRNNDENAVVLSALRILESRLRIPGISLSNPADVKQYLTLRLSEQEHESFVVLFLDTKNRLIAMEELFRGTLTQTAVYPREVVKAALATNAAAVIVAHNHPSGAKEPSQSDRATTAALKQALALIDVRVLDHFIVAGMAQYSFAEYGDL